LNPDLEIESILRQGAKTAPESLFSRVESGIAERRRANRRRQAFGFTALAAGLILGISLFFFVPEKGKVNTARNAAYLDGIFSTFTSAETATDSAYSLLTVNDDDILSVFHPGYDASDVTLVDF